MFTTFLLYLAVMINASSPKHRLLQKEEITALKYYDDVESINDIKFEKRGTGQRKSPSSGCDFSNWLSNIPDDQLFTLLSLPGTHESCALYGYPVAACQSLTLNEQLVAGIRFFDIRCRHINDVFTIHHGLVYQKINFGSGVRDVCIDFLKEHPSEFIVLMIKPEYEETDCTESFEETMNKYIEGNEEFFFLDFEKENKNNNNIINVGEIRGKIVLIRRFDSSITPMGMKVDFTDNAIFTSYVSPPYEVRVQDCYKVTTIFDRATKWANVEGILKEAKDSKSVNKLFVNYGSGTGILCFPETVASYINPLIGEYLKGSQNGFTGVLMIDFFDSYFDNIVAYVILRNFDINSNLNIFKK